jgi:L-iditol 2-dehydrogenase
LKNAKVGILGSGPIGISVLLSSLHFVAKKVYMTDKIDERLSLASEMGARWTGNPDKEDIVKEILGRETQHIDVVFECCGHQEAVDQAIHLLKPGGKLVIIGIPIFSKWGFDVDDLSRKEICVQNVRRQNMALESTLKLISDSGIKPDKMQTHIFKFKQIKEAFETVARYKDGVMKAMIHF